MLHIDFWPRRQSGISGTGSSSFVNKVITEKRDANLPERVGVMKLYIQRYPRSVTVSQWGKSGSQEVRRAPSEGSEGAGAKWNPGGTRLRTSRQGNQDVRPWIWNHNVVKKIKINIVLFTNPSARAGYDTRSIFKRSLTGLNSEFSFSDKSCLTKAEEPSLSYYLPIAGGRIIGFIPFPRVLVLCEMQSRPGFELVSPCPFPFPTTITITPWAPPKKINIVVLRQSLSASL